MEPLPDDHQENTVSLDSSWAFGYNTLVKLGELPHSGVSNVGINKKEG